MSLISVIIPIYNVEKYLDRCVDSIINQTYKNLEIILVDDGSPDGSPQICDDYAKKDHRVQVIHKKNGGLASARNAGMDVMTGKYLFFLDSDDWLEREALEQLAGDIAPYVRYVIADPSAASFIECIRRHGVFRVRKANNSVLDGIRDTSTLLQAGRIHICEGCTDIIREFGLYC